MIKKFRKKIRCRAIFRKYSGENFLVGPFDACFFFSSLLACSLFFNVVLDKCQIATIPEAQRFRFWKMGTTYGRLEIYIIDRSKHVYVATYLRDFPVNGISARNWYALHAMPKEFYVDGSARRERNVSHILFISICPLLTCYILFTDWYSSLIHVIPGTLDFILREESYQPRKFYIISALLYRE